MLQFDEYKVKLNNLLPQLDDLEQALNLDEAARQVDFLEAQCAADGGNDCKHHHDLLFGVAAHL